jgi:hypothetical protein
MKTIIINEKQIMNLQKANKEMTYYAFVSHVKSYLKKLLTEPVYAQPDDFLKNYGLNGEKLLSELTDNNIVIKNEKIDSSGDKDMFTISYKIPRQNFERKIKRLYSSLFESNIVDEELIVETDCGGVMQGGGGNPNAGQYEQPLFGKPLRRKTLYVTQEQYDKLQNLKEETVMNTAVGDFGYDAPVFAKKGDPTLDHKNMMKKSFKGYDTKK